MVDPAAQVSIGCGEIACSARLFNWRDGSPMNALRDDAFGGPGGWEIR